ncbi:hypothetical protein GCM10027419_54050 [Pandoraea terrae]
MGYGPQAWATHGRWRQASLGARHAALGLALTALLAACAPACGPKAADEPPGTPTSTEAGVVTETLPPERDSVADLRALGPRWQGVAAKPVARIASCTTRAWKQSVPGARVEPVPTAAGQSLHLSSADDGVLAVLDLKTRRDGSESVLFVGGAAPESILSSLRSCL